LRRSYKYLNAVRWLEYQVYKTGLTGIGIEIVGARGILVTRNLRHIRSKIQPDEAVIGAVDVFFLLA